MSIGYFVLQLSKALQAELFWFHSMAGSIKFKVLLFWAVTRAQLKCLCAKVAQSASKSDLQRRVDSMCPCKEVQHLQKEEQKKHQHPFARDPMQEAEGLVQERALGIHKSLFNKWREKMEMEGIILFTNRDYFLKSS